MMFSRFSGLFGIGRSTALDRRFAAQIPEGERVYAIGDIHGRVDLLALLLNQIQTDAAGYDGRITLVGLGDYINRGPDSADVITLLRTLPPAWQCVFLRGNHEQAMLDFLADPARDEWLAWGGITTLESYGIRPFGARGLRPREALAAELQQALDANSHSHFFTTTVLYHTCGTYAFVHAGVRPRVALERQISSDLLFIRDDFIGRDHGLPYRIVFGHTILPATLVQDDRIGLDTGAFQTGVLSAVALEGLDVRVLQATLHNQPDASTR